MKKKKFISFLAISALSTGLLSSFIYAADKPVNTTQSFTIEDSETIDLGGSYSNDLFSYNIVSTSSNGQYDGNRINYFDFKNTFTMKSSAERKLVDFVLDYDHVYYSVNYWGSNPIATPMIYDNASHSFKLPEPWILDDASSLDTSASLSSTDSDPGVHLFITDQNPGAANVNDLSYLPKSDVNTVISDSEDNLVGVNQFFKTNMKNPSSTPLDSELPTIQFHVNDSLVNVPIVKNIRIHQEKIAAYGLDGGRWYAISFTPTAKYTYQYDRTITVNTPQDQLNVLSGNTATFSSNIAITDDKATNYTYNWQVSRDGGVTYEDIAGTNTLDYTFTTNSSENGNLYRLKVIPTNAIGTVTEMYSEPATLTVETPIPLYGKVIASYQDTNGNTIAPNDTIEGELGTSYHVDAKAISGYTLVALPTNCDGTYQSQDQTVTFVYKADDIIATPSKKLPSNTETVVSAASIKTGDSTDMVGLFILGGMSIVVIAGVLIFRHLNKLK